MTMRGTSSVQRTLYLSLGCGLGTLQYSLFYFVDQTGDALPPRDKYMPRCVILEPAKLLCSALCSRLAEIHRCIETKSHCATRLQRAIHQNQSAMDRERGHSKEHMDPVCMAMEFCIVHTDEGIGMSIGMSNLRPYKAIGSCTMGRRFIPHSTVT